MKVLNLVTNERPFFKSQVKILEKKGVKQTTISVPNEFKPSEGKNRSVIDYIRFYPRVVLESFNSYDLVHANNGLTAPHAIMQPKLPVVISFWGMDVVSNKYKKAAVSQAVAKRADEVIVMSDEMADHFNRPVHVIPHGVDMHIFQPIDHQVALDLVGWAKSSKHILFPYSPEREEKNFDLALKVFQKIKNETDINIELHQIHGVPHDEIPYYMNAADLLLLTSRYEGSPNTVKEAMACNLPIVATDVGDVSNQLYRVSNSYVCDDKLELFERSVQILNSGNRSNGRDKIKNMSLDKMGDQILKIYKRVINNE